LFICLFLLLRLYSHHSPSPYPPLLPSDQHPPCPLSQLKTIWLGLPPSIIMGARRQPLRLARGSAKSVCLRAHCYLHHALSRLHTRPRTLTTPLNATTLHTSLPRVPRLHPAPHSHLYFGYKLPVWHVPSGVVSTAATARPTVERQSSRKHQMGSVKERFPREATSKKTWWSRLVDGKEPVCSFAGTFVMIVGALVTWAIYTQGRLLL